MTDFTAPSMRDMHSSIVVAENFLCLSHVFIPWTHFTKGSFSQLDSGNFNLFQMLSKRSLDTFGHRPLIRYVKLWVAHAPRMSRTFSLPPTSKETFTEFEYRANIVVKWTAA